MPAPPPQDFVVTPDQLCVGLFIHIDLPWFSHPFSFNSFKIRTPEQIKTGLLTPMIGNTYSGSALIGLSAILDVAKPGDLILMTSYGSGAGSDAFVIRVQDAIRERQDKALTTQDYIARRTEIDYATYVRFRGEITVK